MKQPGAFDVDVHIAMYTGCLRFWEGVSSTNFDPGLSQPGRKSALRRSLSGSREPGCSSAGLESPAGKPRVPRPSTRTATSTTCRWSTAQGPARPAPGSDASCHPCPSSSHCGEPCTEARPHFVPTHLVGVSGDDSIHSHSREASCHSHAAVQVGVRLVGLHESQHSCSSKLSSSVET